MRSAWDIPTGKQFITRSPLIRSILTLGEQRGVQTQGTRAAVNELARILGITRAAVFHWKTIPKLRIYQLKELRPEWFK